MLRIEVRDTGIGIRAQDQPRIFEEFFQVGNPGRISKQGLGLGLSIVQRLCRLLGYTMRIASDYGKGTVFSFELPLVGDAIGIDTAPEKSAAPPAELTGKLVVVIDNETAIIEGMTALLSAWGADVIASTTGNDVVQAVYDAGRMPDLLIVDYRLGIDENGIEVAQRIRQELDPEIAAILITGSVTPEITARARAANLDFLLKPVNAGALRERIAAAFSTRA
jgi:CheY-like chemotaxis protein